MTAPTGMAWAGLRLPEDPAPREVVWLALASGAGLGVVLLDAAGVPLGPLRLVAGLFLGAFAPGAALLALLRPAFLALVARAVLSIPISLAMLALAGVVLDRTPVGISPASMAAASGLLTAVLLAAGYRRWVTPPAAPVVAGTGEPGTGELEAVADATASAGDGAADAVGTAIEPIPPGVRGASLARTVVGHLRDPLFLNAYALGLSGVLTSGLGVAYWAVAARLYPPDVVGVNAALLSLVTLLANVSQLNLRSGFGRFVPIAGRRTRALIHGGYLAALALAAATGIGVVVVLAVAPDVLSDIELTPLLAWLFPLAVILWTAFNVQDHALVALRRTAVVPVENGVFALVKILLLVPLAGVASQYGILVSWVLPTAVGVALVSGWILTRLVPRQQRVAEAGGGAGGAELVTAREVVHYVGADYLGSLLSIGSTSILPVMVLAALGAASSAHFYMVGMIAVATQLIPSVLATSLLVEVASSKAVFDVDGRRVMRQLALLLGPIVVVLVLFAEPILGIFGPSYAAEGAFALRLLALAGIPWSLITMAFIRMRLEGRVRWVVVAQAVLAAMLIVPAVLVLPAWGISGLGAVTLVSQTLVAAVLSWAELRPMLRGLLGQGDDGPAVEAPDPTASR